MGDKKKERKSIVNEVLEIWQRLWRQYPDEDGEDVEPEELDQGRYKKKWEIKIPDDDTKP